MPLINPKKSEKQDDFVSRCMGDDTMNKEYPNEKQRAAVCYSQFKKAKASAVATIGFDKDEVLISFEFPKCFDCDELGTEEDLTVNNVYFSEEVEYVTAEEVAFDENDLVEIDIAKERPGLWENIRRKKQREGKNYRPAKPGSKDRPDPKAWKKAQGAEYQGRKVTLNKPFRTPKGPKKFAVYVKNKSGNVVIVRFGDPGLSIKKHIPERRKNFRARHGCDTDPRAKDKTTRKYWSCRQW
jgi:hypothetical protein